MTNPAKSTAAISRAAATIHRNTARLLFLLSLMSALLAAGTLSAKTLTWQSTSSTAWETAANWFDEGTLATSTTAPTSADTVTINSSRGATAQPSVTAAAQAAKFLTVGSGFTLTLSGASVGLTVGDGLAANNDITIQSGGTIINASTAASGTPFAVVSTTNDRFRIDGGGTYVHNTTRSYTTPFPAATQNFDAGSTFIFRGSSTVATTVVFSSRTFGNLTIESSSGAYTVTAATGTGTVTINGNLSIGATGAGTVSWTLATGTTAPFNVASNLSIGTGSAITFPEIPITLNGNLVNNGTMTINATSGIFTFNGAAATVSGSATAAFGGGFSINAAKSVTLSTGMSVASGKTGTVNGTLNCGTSTVSGAGNFTLAAGATLGIGSATGVDGNITVSGTKSLNAAATYVFNGTAGQTTAGLPATVVGLTISNSLAVATGGVTNSANVTVTNLTLTAGRFVTGANQISVADAGSVTGGSSGSYVDGKLQKVWTSTGTKSFTFPVGTGATYAPCSVSSAVLTSAGNLTASTATGDHASIGSSTIDSTKDANRSWTMTAGGGLGVSTYSAACTFDSGDLDGGANSAVFVMEKYNGSSWARAASSSVSGNTVTGNGFTSFSDFAVGEPAAVPTNPAGVGAANPASVGRGNSTLLTVTVTPGTFPTSTGLAVSADLSSIGGSSSQAFLDNGTGGDVSAGDNIFSYTATVSTGTTLGAKSLSTVITDAQLRTNTAAVVSVTVIGTTRTWSGGGSDDNWSTSANWSGSLAPISPADSVEFTGSTRLGPVLDSSTTVPSLSFASGAGSFSLVASGGSTLTLGGAGITNSSANAQVVNLPLVLGTAQSVNAIGAGTLTIAGSIDNSGNLLTADGANNSALSGNISGGGGFTKAGTGTSTLSGNNTYGGSTTLSAGTLAVSGGSAIPDGSAITLADASGVTLSLGASEAVGSLAGGGVTGGIVALGANNLTVGGGTTYSGTVTGTGKLIKAGTGTLTLNSAGAIGSGFTTRIEGGTVDFNRGGSSLVGIIGSGNSVELAGGTLQLSASVQANFAVVFDGLNVVSNSTFSFNRTGTSSGQSPVITAPLNFYNNANLSFAYNAQITGGTASLNGAANTLFSDGTLTLGSFGITITNAIGESGGSHSLTKAGPGTLNLLAVNTYSGNTTNLAGVIGLNGTSTFGDGTGTLVLAGGDVLANNTRAGAPIANRVSLIASSTSTIYGDSTLTAARILPFSGPLSGTSGTLRIGNKATVANSFQVRFSGGGFNFARPIIVGDPSFDSATGTSLLVFYNDNATAPQIFSGAISASSAGGIMRTAPSSGTGGTTILSGNSTFSCDLTNSGGYLGIGLDSTPTTGTVTSGPLGTGTLEFQVDPNLGIFAYGGARTIANRIFLNGTGGTLNVLIGGSENLTFTGPWNVGNSSKFLNVTNTGLTTIAGSITNSGTGQLTKTGNGTLVLAGDNLYNGTMTNAGGTLVVNGNNFSNAIVVATGATLSGTGAVKSVVVNAGGTLAPGSSIGTFTVGGPVTLSGTTSIEVDKGAGQTSDQVLGITTLTEGGTLQVSNLGAALAAGDSFPVFTATIYSGSFATVTPSPGAGLAWDTEMLRTNGVLRVHNAPVAGNDSAGAQLGQTITIPVTKLIGNDSDADNDPLSITAVSANASVGGGVITYTAPSSGTSDVITYTLSDGRGGTATGTINVTLTSSGASFNQLSAVVIGGGDLQLTYLGIPGTNYALEVTHDLTPPVSWAALQTNPASPTGQIVFTNTPSLAPTNDFYRTSYAP
jgi:autotransporter-associated beta strand protein